MFSFLQVNDPGAPGVGVGFTDRLNGRSAGSLGPLNLGRSDVDEPSAVAANVATVEHALGLRALVTTAQVHGADVLHVDQALVDGWGPLSPLGSDGGVEPLRVADAQVLAGDELRDVALCIRVADCVPVLFADAAARVIGAAHAGRVGFQRGVLPATLDAMRALGARDIQAWVGPHICGSCYEVPAAMRDEVAAEHPAAAGTTRWGTPALDLGAGCAAQLEEFGVAVMRVDPCTFENESLHSHRRDGNGAGRLAGLIWLTRPARSSA